MVSNLVLGRSIALGAATVDYIYSEKDLSDTVWFGVQIAAILGAEKVLQVLTGAAARTPYAMSLYIPYGLGLGISYIIDEGEGVINYNDFIFGMDVEEKIEATEQSIEIIAEETIRRATPLVEGLFNVTMRLNKEHDIYRYMAPSPGRTALQAIRYGYIPKYVNLF